MSSTLEAEPTTPLSTYTLAQCVLEQLGTPPRLIKVDCKHLYLDRWRVNVWCEDITDNVVASGHIAYSYFVVFDGDVITTAWPPIGPTARVP